MNKLTKTKNPYFRKAVVLGGVIFTCGLSSVQAKTTYTDSDDYGYTQTTNHYSQGNQGGQVSNPFNPTPTTSTFSNIDSVDFRKEIINTPCLMIKNFDKTYGTSIDGTFFNVKFNQRLKTSASEWYVTSAVPESACTDAQVINPFTPNTTTTNSTGTTVRNYQSMGKTSSVDFDLELIDIPCLQIKEFAPTVDGTYYHVTLKQQSIQNISDWKVQDAIQAPECGNTSKNLFQ